MFSGTDYEETTGECRGGASPENNAGRTFYFDRDCIVRCDSAPNCAGVVVGSCWCETYESVGAVGNGNPDITCQMKKKGWMQVRIYNF